MLRRLLVSSPGNTLDSVQGRTKAARDQSGTELLLWLHRQFFFFFFFGEDIYFVKKGMLLTFPLKYLKNSHVSAGAGDIKLCLHLR